MKEKKKHYPQSEHLSTSKKHFVPIFDKSGKERNDLYYNMCKRNDYYCRDILGNDKEYPSELNRGVNFGPK